MKAMVFTAMIFTFCQLIFMMNSQKWMLVDYVAPYKKWVVVSGWFSSRSRTV